MSATTIYDELHDAVAEAKGLTDRAVAENRDLSEGERTRFADLQAKAVWEPAAGRKVSFFGLLSRQAAAVEIDDDEAKGEFQDDTDNDLAWARFDSPIGTTGQSHTVVAYSDTR